MTPIPLTDEMRLRERKGVPCSPQALLLEASQGEITLGFLTTGIVQFLDRPTPPSIDDGLARKLGIYEPYETGSHAGFCILGRNDALRLINQNDIRVGVARTESGERICLHPHMQLTPTQLFVLAPIPQAVKAESDLSSHQTTSEEVTGVLGEDTRLVAWRRAMVSQWKAIQSACPNRYPNGRDVMEWLKSNDSDGCIVSSNDSGSLRWRDSVGETHDLTLKTIRNAISELANKKLIPANPAPSRRRSRPRSRIPTGNVNS